MFEESKSCSRHQFDISQWIERNTGQLNKSKWKLIEIDLLIYLEMQKVFIKKKKNKVHHVFTKWMVYQILELFLVWVNYRLKDHNFKLNKLDCSPPLSDSLVELLSLHKIKLQEKGWLLILVFLINLIWNFQNGFPGSFSMFWYLQHLYVFSSL